MSNKQQTAVEFLEQQIIRFHNWKLSPIYDENCVDEIELDKFIKQAKAMEKEQIKDAYKFGIQDEYVIGSENYYIDNYGM
jgi:hypothetical protein